MPIRVKYNSDVRFRRRAAFYNFYRARDSRIRFALEIVVAVVAAVAAAIIWRNSQDIPVLMNYVFYGCALLAIYFGVRVIRLLFVLERVKKLSAFDQAREYHFFENGFRFGPTDQMGTMLENRWREVDHAYQVGDVVYLLCKNRSNWAPVDLTQVIEGDAQELEALLRRNIPGKRYSKR